MLRFGFLLGFLAVFLQIAVFLQPLLPQQYQIAPVCEMITRALLEPVAFSAQQASHQDHQVNSAHADHVQPQAHLGHVQVDHEATHDHHDPNHQCQYCTVFGHLVLPPELSVREVLVRIHIRLIAFEKAFKHVYFILHRLYLLPQGRAPPRFA